MLVFSAHSLPLVEEKASPYQKRVIRPFVVTSDGSIITKKKTSGIIVVFEKFIVGFKKKKLNNYSTSSNSVVFLFSLLKPFFFYKNLHKNKNHIKIKKMDRTVFIHIFCSTKVDILS